MNQVIIRRKYFPVPPFHLLQLKTAIFRFPFSIYRIRMEDSINDNKRDAEEVQITDKPKEKKVRRCVKKLDCALEKEVGIES